MHANQQKTPKCPFVTAGENYQITESNPMPPQQLLFYCLRQLSASAHLTRSILVARASHQGSSELLSAHNDFCASEVGRIYSLLVVSMLVNKGLGQDSNHVQERRDFLQEFVQSSDILDDRHPNDVPGT
jgi:hypothetical protein